VTQNIFFAYKIGHPEFFPGAEGIAANRLRGMNVNLGYEINPRLWIIFQTRT